MADFIIISYDLWLYVMDTQVKMGAEVLTDQRLVMSWMKWQGKLLNRPGKNK